MIKVEGKQVQIEGSTKDLINEAVRAIVAITESYYGLKIKKGYKKEDAILASADVSSEILAKSTIACRNRLGDKLMVNTSEEEEGCVQEL